MKGSHPLFSPNTTTKYNRAERLEPAPSSLSYLRTFATNAGSNYTASKASTHSYISSNPPVRYTQAPSVSSTYSQGVPKYSPSSHSRPYGSSAYTTHSLGNKGQSSNLLSVPAPTEPQTTLNHISAASSYADIDIGESLEKISHQIPIQEKIQVSLPNGNRSPSPISNPTQTSLGEIPYFVGSKGSPLTKAGGIYDFVSSPYHMHGGKEEMISPKSPFRVRNYSEPMKSISPYDRGSREDRGLMRIIPLTDR